VPELVTGRADVVVTGTQELPSGLLLRAEISDVYRLAGGRELGLPGYETSLVGYRERGDTDRRRLHARFPLRPRLLAGPGELEQATIHADVSENAPFAGQLLAAAGGSLVAPGIGVTAEPGDVEGTRAASLAALDPTSFAGLLPEGAEALLAFELSVDGVAPGRALDPSFAPQAPEAFFVLARVVSVGGLHGLEPVARFASDTSGNLTALDAAQPGPLGGLRRAGRYALVRLPAPQGVVSGAVRDAAGALAPALPVEVAGQPWLTTSDAGGRYALLAPQGDVLGIAHDPASGDEGRGTGALADLAAGLALDLAIGPTGPRVASIDPADGATAVDPVASVRVVFSERIVPASLGPGGIALRDASGASLPGTLSLDSTARIATFAPAALLANASAHTVEIADTVRDLQGLAISGPRSFSFTTEPIASRGLGAQLVSWEPGSETAECDDVPGFDTAQSTIACMRGSPGTADPGVPVILVNDTTGATATTLSKPDGSFAGFVDASVDDFLSATFVNANGTRISIDVVKQLFDDGSVGLFSAGGTLEAQGAQGPVEVVVEPGAIEGKTRLKLTVVPPEVTEDLFGDTPPQDGQLLSEGYVLSTAGDPLKVAPDVRIPVDTDALVAQGFDPSKPEEATFALVSPREVDGVVAYQILDSLQFENGALVSHSPPFPGPNPDPTQPPPIPCQPPANLSAFENVTGALELALLVLDPSGLGFVAEKIAFWPLQMAIRARPVNFTGEVQELIPNDNACTQGALPLGGALVTVQLVTGPGSLVPPRQGRLDPGESFAVSDAGGRYALLLPRLATDEPHALTAQHPRHLGLRIVEPANEVIDPDAFGILLSKFGQLDFPHPTSRTDLIFPPPLGRTREAPPELSVSHVPLLPAPGATVELRTFANHGFETPTITLALLGVQALGSGTSVALSDVAVGPPVDQSVGAHGLRRTFPIVGAKPLRALFRVEASVPGADPAVVEYGIEFGGSPPPPAGGLTPSDVNDDVPPQVLTTWPADGAIGVVPGEPILVDFSEPIDKTSLQAFSAVTLSGPGSPVPHLELTPDQTRLAITVEALEPGELYTLTLTSSLTDLAGNPLDKDPTTPFPDSVSIEFRASPLVHGDLGLEYGAGAVVRGIYAFALDRRGTTEGALVALDLSDPDQPVEVGRFNLPAFPRDLALIPEYSIVREPGDAPRTRNLVAVVGGLVGGSTGTQGEFVGSGQFLIVVDVTDPHDMKRFASALLSLGTSVVPRVVWSPPLLGYVDSNADLQSVGVLNLQTFALGTNATPQEAAQFPVNGTPGVDANGDGDFTDDGEELPLPCRCPGEVAGKVLAFPLGRTSQKINDLVVDGLGGVVAVTVSQGRLRAPDGQPIGGEIAPLYRTFFKGGAALQPPNADFSFPLATDPKRLRVFLGLPILVNGNPTPTDVAIVSLNPAGGASGKLVVLDITDPLAVVLLNQIDVPASHGLVQSVDLRDDGLLMLATTNDVVLVDPLRVAEPPPAQGEHPALVSTIQGAGSGQRTIGGIAAGFQLVNLGAKTEVVQAAPQLSFVRVPGVTPFEPEDLASDDALRAQVLAGAERVGAVFPSRVTASAGVASDLDPPSPLTHYYVRVDAPGSAGGFSGTLEIALESLDAGGEPLRNLGFLYAPPRAMDGITEIQIGGDPREPCDAPSTKFEAHRISDDKTHPDYNVFLAGPFVLVMEEMPKALLDLVKANPLPRQVLWSGFAVRATIDPTVPFFNAVGPFASEVDLALERLEPGAGAIAFSFPGDYILGPNPEPILGGASMPASFGAVMAHNGELRISDNDFTLPGRRLEIDWTRTFAAQDLHTGPLGRGWDFPYNQRLQELAPERFGFGQIPLVERADAALNTVASGGDVLFNDGEGHSILFRNAGTSPPEPDVTLDPLVQQLGWIPETLFFYLPERGAFDLLFKFKDGRFARLTPDGTQFWYDPDGKLSKIYDRFEENTIKLFYNRRRELVQIKDELDRAIDLGWYRFPLDPLLGPLDTVTQLAHEAGKIALVRDYSGRDFRYRYDPQGLLQERRGPNITQAALGGFTGDEVVTYLYSDCSDAAKSGNVIVGTVEPGASGTPIVNAQQFAAGSRDRIERGTTPGAGFDASYNYANRAADIAAASANFTGPGGLGTKYTFNAFAQPEEIAVGGNRIYGYRYNADGLVAEMTYPEGNSVEYVYDSDPTTPRRARANLVAQIRKPSSATDPTYTATSDYDESYQLPVGTQTDFAGNSYTVVLTNQNRQIDRIDYPTGESDQFTYNIFGQVERHETADGLDIRTSYDGQGFVELRRFGSAPSVVIPGGGGFPPSSGVGSETFFKYGGSAGQRGLPSESRDGNGTVTKLTWNERDQLVRSDRAGFVQESGYDANGREEAVGTTVDPGEVLVERRQFDPSGFLERVTLEGLPVGDAVGPIPIEVKIFPDAAKRIARIEYDNGDVTRFFYDSLGQVERRTTGLYEESYEYDLNGIVEVERVGGVETRHTLDGHGRMHVSRSPEDTVVTTDFDGNDLPVHVKVEDPQFGVLEERHNTYDARGRLERADILGAGAIPPQTIGYDSSSQRVVRTDSDGVSEVAEYDDAGRTDRTFDPLHQTRLVLDANGNVLESHSEQDGRTYSVFASYDARDAAVTQSDLVGPVFPVMDRRLDGALASTQDALGRTTQRELTAAGELLRTEKPNGVVEERRYDERRRLAVIRDASSNATRNQFDSSATLFATLLPDGTGTVLSSFDVHRIPRTITQANVVVATRQLDDEGRPTGVSFSGLGAPFDRNETFAYDGLDRVRESTYPGGSMTFDFDTRNLLEEARYEIGGVSFAVGHGYTPGGRRRELRYPAEAVSEGRDAGNRILSIIPASGPPVVSQTTFAGAELVSSRSLGGGLSLAADYDLRKRPLFRRYTDRQGRALLDLRYVFDSVDDLVARQRMDRGGRTDFYRYDAGSRLTRVDAGARPTAAGEVPRALSGFAPPAQVGGAWSPGFYAREFAYDDRDVFTGVTEILPDPVPIPPFASSFGSADSLLHLGQVDGVTRSRDALGNTETLRIYARDGASAGPVPMTARLGHDGKSQLVRVTREDGTVVESRYRSDGLRSERIVTCGSAPGCRSSHTGYLYHEEQLLEEYDLSAGSLRLRARYYYDDSNGEVLSADLDPGTGALQRFYYLTDFDGSVMAVADGSGELVERVSYDAWGEPSIERADFQAPRVRRVLADGDDLLIEMSERVLPSGASAVTVTSGGSPVPGQVVYRENEPGFAFGSVLRFAPAAPLAGLVSLDVAAGSVVDESGNGVAAATLSIVAGAPSGSVVFANPDQGSTAPEPLARSSIGSPFLFHGEYFDYETGLLYLRARFYQPASGLFLERDPQPYGDSVNAYAGMANNPVRFGDPSGEGVITSLLKAAGRYVAKAAAKAGRGSARAASRLVRSAGRKVFGGALGRRFSRLAGRFDQQVLKNVPAQRAGGAFNLADVPINGVKGGGGKAVKLELDEVAQGVVRGTKNAKPLDDVDNFFDADELADLHRAGKSGADPTIPVDDYLRQVAQRFFPELKRINPLCGTTNCVHVANTLIERLLHGATRAARKFNPPGVENGLRGFRYAKDAADPVDSHMIAENLAHVVRRAEAAGDGSVFHLAGLNVKNHAVEFGHAMTVVNRRGLVYILDGQTESFARNLTKRFSFFATVRVQ
jgi:RHS repeat-associated protein